MQYYSNRPLYGLLALLMAGVVYIVLTKELLDVVTEFAAVVIQLMLVVAVFMGLVSIYRMCPVVVMSEEGILVKKFVFLKEYIPWSEILDITEDQYKNRVGTADIGRVRGTTTLLKIHRPNKRAVSINLTLLNKRGEEFHSNLGNFSVA